MRFVQQRVTKSSRLPAKIRRYRGTNHPIHKEKVIIFQE
jgi:hypothetical protein